MECPCFLTTCNGVWTLHQGALNAGWARTQVLTLAIEACWRLASREANGREQKHSMEQVLFMHLSRFEGILNI